MSIHATPPARWRKSHRCGANNTCVEVARGEDGTVSVRDGAQGADAPRLSFGIGEWRRFTRAAKGGRFDRP